MTTTIASKDPIVAPEEERSTIASIEEYLESKRGRAARLVGPNKDAVLIPSSLRRVLVAAARQLAGGNGVSIIPVTAEVTTQQAADLLNVSRPFVVGLLDKGEIPFHKVGTHRRIRLKDLLAYRRRRDASRHAVIDRLAAEAQELGIYEE
jgi:excisionase family DNA binding protein